MVLVALGYLEHVVHSWMCFGHVGAGASPKALSAFALHWAAAVPQQCGKSADYHGWKIAAISNLDDGTCDCYA